MSLEKFQRRSEILHQRMQQISRSRDAGQLLQHRRHFNPEVRSLLVAQERLLDAAERLIDRLGDG